MRVANASTGGTATVFPRTIVPGYRRRHNSDGRKRRCRATGQHHSAARPRRHMRHHGLCVVNHCHHLPAGDSPRPRGGSGSIKSDGSLGIDARNASAPTARRRPTRKSMAWALANAPTCRMSAACHESKQACSSGVRFPPAPSRPRLPLVHQSCRSADPSISVTRLHYSLTNEPGVSPTAKQLGEHHHTSRQVILCHFFRDPETLRRLSLGQPLNTPQDQSLAISLRNMGQGVGNLLDFPLKFQAIFRAHFGQCHV